MSAGMLSEEGNVVTSLLPSAGGLAGPPEESFPRGKEGQSRRPSSESILLPIATRIMRESVKNKSYRAYPMGGEAGHYLRWKRGRLTPKSHTDYEAILDKLARAFPDLEITDFEPPIGTERLEEFLDERWGASAPATYNQALSVCKNFFQWAVLKDKLHGDPSLPILPHKKRDSHREFFSESDLQRIIADGPDPERLFRDRVALRLLLHYGLRKGALQSVQFKHFDHNRRRLTIFTKGEKVHTVPLPEEALWFDLERHILDWEAHPEDFLLPRRKKMWRGYDRKTYDSTFEWVEWRVRDGDTPTCKPEPMGQNGLHGWWYECQARAGIVPKGVRRGSKTHKARHTAGQRVLDKTKGNLKATQMLLGHKDIATTGNLYVSWDIESLEETMRMVVSDE